MLTTDLIHPQVLGALAAAGHGSKVLIADGNYPMATAVNSTARKVYLNFRPGVLTVTEIVAGLLTAVQIEAAEIMRPDGGASVPIFDEFDRLLDGMPLAPLERHRFYAAAGAPDVALAIASGDQRHFANLLLTIGVVPERAR